MHGIIFQLFQKPCLNECKQCVTHRVQTNKYIIDLVTYAWIFNKKVRNQYKRSLHAGGSFNRHFKKKTSENNSFHSRFFMEWKAVVIVIFCLMATTIVLQSAISPIISNHLLQKCYTQLKQTGATDMYKDCCQVTTYMMYIIIHDAHNYTWYNYIHIYYIHAYK